FFSSRRRHTRFSRDWSSDVCSSDLFVNFTNADGHTVIARFTRAPATALTVDPDTRVDLRWPDGRTFIEQPFSNHNGGHLAFGPRSEERRVGKEWRSRRSPVQ